MDGQVSPMPNAPVSSSVQTRQRSTIAFPYMDIKAAAELAVAIHDNVGHGECEDDQLAAWSGQSVKSSTFRVQVYAARTLGILEGESGNHKLTELGRALIDPDQTREARIRSFLIVPLYRVIFENHKGGVLPPTAALEREMANLGVAEKQKERARQVFERCAEQAGFFEHGRNRLVMPGMAFREDALKRDAQPQEPVGISSEKRNGNGGNSGDGGNLDPLIAALIQKLPQKGPWGADDRVMWLQMIAMAFQMAYGLDSAIEIRKAS